MIITHQHDCPYVYVKDHFRTAAIRDRSTCSSFFRIRYVAQNIEIQEHTQFTLEFYHKPARFARAKAEVIKIYEDRWIRIR